MQTPRVLRWNHADFEKMAEYAGLQNQVLLLTQDKAKLAAIEVVDLKSKLDERSTDLYNMDADMKQEYPYVKKLSGALKCETMPWDHQNQSTFYFNAGLVSGMASAALLFF